ncbi:YxeA family protein [Clostridium sp. MSJ-4]|uniref:YxeA family protein n=1 Tax=Clostridium simiarum TaxID=2841506 RepID=A0ABS6EWM3_9CLOT|nr:MULTISPECIES: YxeA family protein [Clostridium]MBU5590625.1 YxeA family protein [Clostridium simiarum]
MKKSGKYIAIFIMLLTFGTVLSGCNTVNVKKVGSKKYYTQIKGKGEKKGADDIQIYEYTLPAYDDKGEKKDITFNGMKQLREDAYLKVYMKKDKAITYEEVEEKDIPEKAKEGLGVKKN